MAGSIKGIIVEIGGDTSGLQKALQQVTKVSNSLSKELRDIDKLLKFNPKSTELLAQKQQVLAESIDNTSKELEQLQTAQKEYDNTGKSKNTQAYRNLQREIIKTKDKLKELKIEASKWTDVSRKLDAMSQKFKKIGQNLTNVGRTLTTKVTVPIVGLGTLSVKTASDFESAFAGVEKTVDGTAEQMDTLRQGIRDMAKEIPASTTEIAAVAEAAGQLGIETDNILKFTRVMIDLGNSTNLSADEAATALAKFANITKTNADDYDKLGATIVDLGNNFATTEADIVHMSTRLAAAGKLAGLSEPDILGLATAMSSVGITAEAGGTAMSKFLNKMQAAVERGPAALDNFNKVFGKFGYSLDDVGKKVAVGGKEFKEFAKKVGMSTKDIKTIYKETTKSAGALDDFAKVAGMSSADFSKAFKEDAAGALTAFLTGLNDVERNGKTAGLVLDDMGITEQRMRDALLRLSQSNGILTSSLEKGQTAWDNNSALTKEATKRYETFQSKVNTTKNKINDLGITIGNELLPSVEKVVDKISELAEKFSNMSPETKQMIIRLAMLAAAIGPILLIVGKLFTAGGVILKIGSTIAGLIAKLSVTFGGLSGVLAALTGPIGITIAAIAGLVAAFVYLWNTSEDFRNTMTELGQQFVDIWDNTIKPTFAMLIEAVKELWTGVLTPLVGWIMTVFGPRIQTIFNTVGGTVALVIKNFTTKIKTITGVLKGIIKFISGVFSRDWGKAWEGVKDIFGSVFNGIKELVRAPLNWIIDRINDFIREVNKIKIPEGVPKIGGMGFNIPTLNHLATGGIVKSPTLSWVGEGKSPEAVIPLDRNLSNYFADALEKVNRKDSVVVNFYPQKMTDAEMDHAFNYINRKFGLLY